jgi:hypothetical protein
MSLKYVENNNENNLRKVETKISKRVDINNLLKRVRKEKRKSHKENMVLLGIVGSAIVVTGIIASL